MFSFVASKLFTRLVGDYLSDDEYVELQLALAEAPERGGIRVIYYAKAHEGVIWMLAIYAKNEEQDIPARVLRKIKEELDG